jgi:hypothetical protein
MNRALELDGGRPRSDMMRVAMSVLVVILIVVLPIALLAFIGKGRRAGVDLSRAGLLELQSLLEPERKVEILREMETQEQLLVRLDDEDGA